MADTLTQAADDAAVDSMLGMRHWIVAGLRDSRIRPAWGVAKYLQSIGKDIYPVHPHPESVHGRPGYASVAEARDAIIAEHGEQALASTVVDCFINSERVGAVVDDAIAAGAAAVWLQLGVVDAEAVRRAGEAGLLAVMDRCPAIEGPKRGFGTGH